MSYPRPTVAAWLPCAYPVQEARRWPGAVVVIVLVLHLASRVELSVVFGQ